MKKYILDASVGAKWFFQEDLDEKARSFDRLLRTKEIAILVPEIFYPEIANTCWKRVRRGILSHADAWDAFDRLMTLPLESHSVRELSEGALDNALEYSISVYDALYLTLAEIYFASFVTADEGLLKACRGRFDFIESLRDVKLS